MSSFAGVKPFQLRQIRRDMAAVFMPSIQRAGDILRGAASPDGTIDPRRTDEVVARVGEVVQRMFVGDNLRSAFGSDGVTPLSPYARILNQWYVRVVFEAIDIQYRWMKRRVPPDVFRYLASVNTRPAIVQEQHNPFLRQPGESDEAFLARMAALRIFAPNPLAELDPRRQWVPMHRFRASGELVPNWRRPDGYTLSDRIWQVSMRTRTQIDALVAEGIREGRSAVWIAQRVEQFLLPTRAAVRTQTPYGQDASFDAMRLARTEIAAAANRAAYTAAYLNPYVDAIEVVRSGNGDPTCPICPQHATIGINGERLRPAYPIQAADTPPYHPHDMCRVQPVVTDNPSAVSQRMRAIIDDERARIFQPVTTPAQPGRLLLELIGQTLFRVAGQDLGIRVGQVRLL